MKYDPRIVRHLNDTLHVSDILEQERGDNIPDCDTSVSCVDHSDKDPSLRVYAEEGRHSYCFSCGKTFTPYLMLKTLFGFNFTEIVEYAIQDYGYQVPEDFGEEKDIDANLEVSRRIRYLRQYSTPKVLNLLSKALFVDTKNGNTNAVFSLYEKVILIKESDCI